MAVRDDAVIEWLLEGDPAIRWQVMRDLLDAPPGDWERGFAFSGAMMAF